MREAREGIKVTEKREVDTYKGMCPESNDLNTSIINILRTYFLQRKIYGTTLINNPLPTDLLHLFDPLH